MNPYEEKLERRRERLLDRARNKQREGDARYNRAHKMAEAIPFGQPILVGHHSEKRDRNYRAKIHNGFGKAFELMNEAKELEARADAVGTGGISSDDPEAIAKLKEKLAGLEAEQAMMVAVNKIVRKFAGKDEAAGIAELVKMGKTEAEGAEFFKGDFIGRKGYPAYALANNNGNMARIRDRIGFLERNAKREHKETLHNSGVKLVENVELNRVQLIFPGKPSAEIRANLKSRGFRWSPSEGAWQRQLGTSAIWMAQHILESLTPKEESIVENSPALVVEDNQT